MIKKVTYHAITNYQIKKKGVIDNATIDRWADKDFMANYHAFTSLAYSKTDGYLYCGVTNFGNDVLYRFDPATKKLESLKYQNAKFAEKFDIKLHRSTAIGADGNVYGATSCLHGIHQRPEGPGGKVFRYNPSTGKYTLLCIPKKRDYIQTITLDDKRGMIYGFTYPVFEFFAYSIKRDAVLFCEFMDSIVHVSALDDKGRYWGTWDGVRHCLFHYDPQTNKVVYHNVVFPEPCRSLMYRNAGPIDSMVNGGDGCLYIGLESGSLYRFEPDSVKLTYLGRPFPFTRLPGLILGDDGLLYGCGGDNDDCALFSYDRSKKTFTNLGKIAKGSISCFRTHDLAKIGDVIYVGETDHLSRTNYLWECKMD